MMFSALLVFLRALDERSPHQSSENSPSTARKMLALNAFYDTRSFVTASGWADVDRGVIEPAFNQVPFKELLSLADGKQFVKSVSLKKVNWP